MKVVTDQIDSIARPTSGAKTVRGAEEPLEIKKLRLRKATKEFESFFVLYMLRAMRETVPESGLLEGGLGKDVYTSMFDEELAKTIAGNTPNSLAELLYKSLEKQLEAKPAEDASIEKAPTVIPNQPEAPMPAIPDTDPLPDRLHRGGHSVEGSEETRLGGPRPVSQSPPRIHDDPVLKRFGPTIRRASQRYNVDSRLIHAVIMAESSGRPEAVSVRGAKGLMQLTDSTAADLGVKDSLDPHENIMAGTRYLKQLLDRYDGNIRLALAAYNAGPGAISKYDGIPPFRETRRYVEKVLARLHNVKMG